MKDLSGPAQTMVELELLTREEVGYFSEAALVQYMPPPGSEGYRYAHYHLKVFFSKARELGLMQILGSIEEEHIPSLRLSEGLIEWAINTNRTFIDEPQGSHTQRIKVQKKVLQNINQTLNAQEFSSSTHQDAVKAIFNILQSKNSVDVYHKVIKLYNKGERLGAVENSFNDLRAWDQEKIRLLTSDNAMDAYEKHRVHVSDLQDLDIEKIKLLIRLCEGNYRNQIRAPTKFKNPKNA